MYLVIWEYAVVEERRAEFEGAYSADGEWSALFQEAQGYLGTELYRDGEQADRYITIDRWLSQPAYQRFLDEHCAEYETVDRKYSRLIQSERRLGGFEDA
jgi:heme-degrading monooxygenase HmoA